jgi:hypothetical protein
MSETVDLTGATPVALSQMEQRGGLPEGTE